MHPFRVALLGCFQAEHHHVEDDRDVDGENQKANPVGLSQQISYFERDVDGARGDGQPLRPGAYVPQAVGFDEAKDYVDRRYHGYLPQADVADPVHEIDKDTNEVVVGIGVEKFEEGLGDSPDIFVAHGEYTEAGENDDYAFGKFPDGDGAHAFDVLGIVDSRMRDYGVHLVKIYFLGQRLIADSF